MINTVIFDIGRVLIGFEWRDYVHKLFNDPELEDIVSRACFETDIWKEMDRGIWTEEEVLKMYCDLAPAYSEQIRYAFDHVGECTQRTDYAIPWIEELKAAGYRVLFLSNYSEHVKRRSMHALDFLPHMEGGIFSCDVHMVKPEREIYELLMERYELKPEECVFIDDGVKNIDAARALGIHGIVFDHYEQAYGELKALLAANH